MDLQLNGSVRDPEMPKMTAVCSKEQGAHGFDSDRPALELYGYDSLVHKAGVKAGVKAYFSPTAAEA